MNPFQAIQKLDGQLQPLIQRISVAEAFHNITKKR